MSVQLITSAKEVVCIPAGFLSSLLVYEQDYIVTEHQLDGFQRKLSVRTGIGPREEPLNFGLDSNKVLELGRDMDSTECYSGSNVLKYTCIIFFDDQLTGECIPDVLQKTDLMRVKNKAFTQLANQITFVVYSMSNCRR